jgi:hypothetical protein
MNTMAGADQGQGVWQSWIKITGMSASEIRERMGKDDDFDPKTIYLISQMAHITCKKDKHKILIHTVSEDLSSGYEKLCASALVLVRLCNKEKDCSCTKVKSVFVSKYARDIKIEKELLHNATSILTMLCNLNTFQPNVFM